MKRHPGNNFRRCFFMHRTESFHTPYGVLSRTVRCAEGLRTVYRRIAYGVWKDSVRCIEEFRTVGAILLPNRSIMVPEIWTVA
ncbi:MAG: hypothetical protein RR346_09915 [Bacteroidales bacterium]